MIAPRTRMRLWRYASIAVLCGLPVLLLGMIASHVLEATQAADQATRKRALTSTIVTQLEKHRARAKAPVDIGSLYLTSMTDSLARAEIQERATKMVAQADGRLAEVQLVTTPEQEAKGTVAIQLSLSIDNKGLLDLLYALESGMPLLDVTSLNVQTSKERGEEGAGPNGALRVEMIVQGHWRKVSG